MIVNGLHELKLTNYITQYKKVSDALHGGAILILRLEMRREYCGYMGRVGGEGILPINTGPD
jgi:hypothetical protein